MYFIESGKDLVGKTIAFIHCAQFAEAITLATTDGGLMVIEQSNDGMDSEIDVYQAHRVEFHLFNKDRHKWMVEELQKLGVIGKEEYEKRCEARRLAKEEGDRKEKERHEECEHKEYLRLKAKFEGV